MMSEDFRMKTGEQAHDFLLPATNGKTYSLGMFTKDVLVIVFTCNHCPYAKAYESRIIELAKQFSGNCDFIAINANDSSKYPDDSFEKMKERAAEKTFPFPYLYDQSQETAKKYGALVTPHAFVFGKARTLAYQGGIDDRFRNGDYNREGTVTADYLANALKELSNGKEATKNTSPVAGCSIKWK